MITYGKTDADLHGRSFETAPGVLRGIHEWRIDFAGAVDQWFCPRCGEDWFEFDQDEPMTLCVAQRPVT